MKSRLFSAALALVASAMDCYGQGTLLAGHFGSADPATEGFILYKAGNPLLTPALNDMGLSAWSISVASNGYSTYFQSLTPQQLDAAARWSISVNLRVLSPFHSPSYGVFCELYTGTSRFLMRFGAEGNGDPLLNVNSVNYSLAGLGPGYHNYDLRFNGGSGVASLWIDGSEEIESLPRSADRNPSSFAWGCGQLPTGIYNFNSNWNEVSLRLIPEPSSLVLICVGIGVVLTRSFPKRLRSSLEDL